MFSMMQLLLLFVIVRLNRPEILAKDGELRTVEQCMNMPFCKREKQQLKLIERMFLLLLVHVWTRCF